MFIKKLLNSAFILITLSGCVQSSAFLGPAVTGASTGNVYQTGLSYSTNLVIKKSTGKTTFENFKELLNPKKNDNELTKSIKKNIKKHSEEFVNFKKKDNSFVKSLDKTIEKNSLEFYTMVKNLYLQDQSN